MRALLLVALVGCGGGAHFGDDAGGDASTGDATVGSDAQDEGPTFGDSSSDASADASCGFGSAGSFATQASLDLFGQTVFFADGGSLPAGHYSIAYVDGCMMYSNVNQGWTVNAHTGDRWYLVDGPGGGSATTEILSPPGTYGYLVDAGAYAVFADCVTANVQQDKPAEFDFDGGVLGLWLSDSPYSDNVAGDNGRNPKWSLTLVGQPCPNAN
jgi:hypothetical protein